MSSAQPTPDGIRAFKAPVRTGFDVADVDLPDAPADLAPERREAAAMMVVAIARGALPEELVDGVSTETLAAWSDPLEREEALAHVDLLATVLVPVRSAA